MRELLRRVGATPYAVAAVGLAGIAMLLSRGAGSGWLVVIAAAFIGVFVIGVVTAVVGLADVRVELLVPTDATVGERIPIEVHLHAAVRQLRTLTFWNLDGSTYPVARGHATIHAEARRRGLVDAVVVEVSSGVTLGLLRPVARRTIELPTPLAIAPRPTPATLSDAIGFDAAADVRSVRSYVAGDPVRLVHWRSTARRGELMVRELEAADQVRGTLLVFRVALGDDADNAEAIASRAAGLACVALDAGLRVRLDTRDARGPQRTAVSTRRDVGRCLAAAVPGPLPAGRAGDRVRVVDVT
ncbi:MAG TPA: DUF58 domain-containing protein [Acidimicrobiales bacterium]|nr:DUF58 domain-containing protein [Acidimicrobiales bacterium]